MEELRLIELNGTYAKQIKEYRAEMLEAGSSMDGCGSLRSIEDPCEYIKNCELYENEKTVPQGKVTSTQYMLVRASDNRLVGMLQIRHYLNEYLRNFGGHIGYSIRPTERCKGYGKQMLGLALPYCKAKGIDNVLVTCLDDNIGSEKIIVANGGIYEATVYEPDTKRYLKRFMIKL